MINQSIRYNHTGKETIERGLTLILRILPD